MSFIESDKDFSVALLLHERGDLERAKQLYETIIHREPDHYKAIMNLGNIHHALKEYDKSISLFHRVISIAPSYAKAYNNLGKVLHDKGEIENAIIFFRKAITLDPLYPNAHFNLALSYLLDGNYEEGWPLYEYRFRIPDTAFIYPHRLKGPRWEGNCFRNLRLLVHTEQGIGDTIQFIRYIPMVKALGGEVIFENLPPLSRLLKNFKGVDRQVILQPDAPFSEDYDCFVPLLSLPLLFKTNLYNIPVEIPYIHADSEKSKSFQRTCESPLLKIGLTWAGKPSHHNDMNRSIPLSFFSFLFKIREIEIYSLQKEVPEKDKGSDLLFLFRRHFGQDLSDFSDTAAVIDNLDLVISVDTATAHIAGAMGKPTFILLPFAPDFRWLRHRPDSPWYPTARLFRQATPFSWEDAIKNLENAVANILKERQHPLEYQNSKCLFEQAMAHLDAGKVQEAYRDYQKVIETTPSCAEAYFYMGIILQQEKKTEKAIAHFEKALSLDPSLHEAQFNLAFIFSQKKMTDRAIEEYERILSAHPDFCEALNNLGTLYSQRKEYQKALSLYKRAISINPDFSDAIYNMSKMYFDRKEYETSEYYAHEVLKINPESASSFNILGRISHIKGNYDHARENYEKALRLLPEDPEINFNLSLIELLTGNFKSGWKRYEWRLKKDNWKRIYPHRFHIQKWSGEELAGKRLLIHGEQGYGDNLQFIRYLSFFEGIKGDVLFESPFELEKLFQYSFGKNKIVSYSKGGNHHCDFFVPLMNLPSIFSTTLGTIPNKVPYLLAPPSSLEKWETRFDKDQFNIGIIWAGTIMDPNRSCPFTFLKPLFKLSHLKFVGLQKGIAAEQLRIEGSSKGVNLLNVGEEFEDFCDTAAAIHCMDLVITIDTSVAHLAGAMGKKVWLMLPFVSDWRWLLNRNDSPWYPTMRLFRQKNPYDWPSVIDMMINVLKEERRESSPSVFSEESFKGCLSEAKEHLLNQRVDAAIEKYEALLKFNPLHSEALEELGICHLKKKDPSKAISCIQKAIDLSTGNAGCYYHLALCYLSLSEKDSIPDSDANEHHFMQCLRLCETNLLKAIAVDPLHADAHYNLAIIYKRIENPEKAKFHYKEAIRARFDFPDAHYNLGNLLMQMGDLHQAHASYLNALRLNDKDPKILNNLGRVNRELGRLDSAIKYYERAITLSDHYPEAHWNLSITHLIRGDFKEGFRGYEWRFKRSKEQTIYPYSFTIPKWKGEPLNGKHIFVHSEQGFGDTIQFSRLLPVLKQTGTLITFEVQKELLPIFIGFPFIDKLFSLPADRTHTAPCDCYTPLLSLPHFLSLSIETIPSRIPYLFPDRKLVDHWKHRIKPSEFSVGIVWAGKPTHENDHNRSLSLSLLSALFSLSGIQFISLQKTGMRLLKEEKKYVHQISFLGEELRHFGDTAALLSHMDLLISVDTATAHLAGAMGIPVWLLLPFAPDWRWMTDRDDSPWYPTMRLFRQNSPGEWSSVISTVYSLLKEQTEKNHMIKRGSATKRFQLPKK